jgi:lipopolysaccharide export system protein LptC
MPSSREYILAIVLAAVGLAAWWLLSANGEVARPAAEGARQPIYRVLGLSASMMDEAGRLRRRLTASEVRHYPADGGSELDDPRLTVFDEGGPPWLLRSPTGWLSKDGDELYLPGTVFIDRQEGPSTRPVHITTWELYVRPREDYARTERPVHLTSGADWLASRGGADIWFGEDLRLRLHGRARIQVAVP